jgi:hypothetical protein
MSYTKNSSITTSQQESDPRQTPTMHLPSSPSSTTHSTPKTASDLPDLSSLLTHFRAHNDRPPQPAHLPRRPKMSFAAYSRANLPPELSVLPRPPYIIIKRTHLPLPVHDTELRTCQTRERAIEALDLYRNWYAGREVKVKPLFGLVEKRRCEVRDWDGGQDEDENKGIGLGFGVWVLDERRWSVRVVENLREEFSSEAGREDGGGCGGAEGGARHIVSWNEDGGFVWR